MGDVRSERGADARGRRRGAAALVAFVVLLGGLQAGMPEANAELLGTTSRQSLHPDGGEFGKPSGRPSISGDGQRIAFEHPFAEEYEGPYSRRVWLRDRQSQTTDMISIDPTGAEFPSAHSPSISEDGSKVAFVAGPAHESAVSGAMIAGRMVYERSDEPGGQTDIFIANSDGSGEVRLTSTPDRSEHHPALSPDGERVAFTVVSGLDTTELWMVNTDGTGLRMLFGGLEDAIFRDPAWSPDGARLALAVYEPSMEALTPPEYDETWIYVVEVDADPPTRQRVSVSGEDRQPTWSPDGEEIAYSGMYRVESGEDTRELFIYNTRFGTTRTIFVSQHGIVPAWPRWSPDGTSIVVLDEPAEGFGSLYLISDLGEPEGSAKRLTNNPDAIDGLGAWRADGSSIVFPRAPQSDPTDSDLHELDPNEEVPEDTVQRLTTTTGTIAHPDLERYERSGDVPVKATATVTGGEDAPTPTGSVRFALCVPGEAPPSCGFLHDEDDLQVGEPVTLDSDATAESPWLSELVPPARLQPLGPPYCWRVEYSGDQLHRPSSSYGEDVGCLEVTKSPPQTNLFLEFEPSSPFAILEVEDASTGWVAFYLCGPGLDGAGCPTGGTYRGLEPIVEGRAALYSTPELEDGRYCWRAEYSGDAWMQRAEVTGPHACFDVIEGSVRLAPVSLTASVTPFTAQAPVDWSTSAELTVSGAADAGPASVRFFLCDPTAETTHGCRTGGFQVGPEVTVEEDGTFFSDAFTMDQPGRWCWRIEYRADQIEYVNDLATTELCRTAVDPFLADPDLELIWLRDLDAGTTTLVSRAVDGGLPDASSWAPSTSYDGSYVAYTTAALNVTDPAPSEYRTTNVVLWDGSTTVLVSERGPCPYPPDEGYSACGLPADEPSISRDGQHVAFSSGASDIAAFHPDTGEPHVDTSLFPPWQVYLRDVAAGRTTIESVTSDGSIPTRDSYEPSLSGDGSMIAFSSDFELVPDDSYSGTDVYVRDVTARSTVLASVSSDETQGLGSSMEPSLSADGTAVAFTSYALGLAPDDPPVGEFPQVFVRDLPAGLTERVSVSSTGVPADAESDNRRPSTSTDGGSVAFESTSPDLVPDDTNEVRDVFVRDRLPRLTATPLSFPPTYVGSSSSSQQVVVRNEGSGPVTITSVGITPAGEGNFEIVSDGCTGATLAREQTCMVEVVFTPQTEGQLQAALRIVSTDPASPTLALLRGRGVAVPTPTPTETETEEEPEGLLHLRPDPVDFGTLAIGSSEDAVVTATASRADVTILSVRITGGGGDFAIAPEGDGCTGLTLYPTELDFADQGTWPECTITVRFTPSDPESRRAILWVRYGDGVSTVRLVGSGGERSIAVSDVDFGVVLAETTSETKAAIVRNTGVSPVRISSVHISGEQADLFDIVDGSDRCTGRVLAAEATCRVDLVLTPDEPGRPQAELLIRSDVDPEEPRRARLIGLSPELEPDPPLGPPGFVTSIKGRFFPPNAALVLQWDPGLGTLNIRSDADGEFTVPMLIFRRDMLGPRRIQAVGDGYIVESDFLVVPGSLQPGEFNIRG